MPASKFSLQVAGLYYLTSLAAPLVGYFVGQILMGVLWGIFASLGIIAAQRLLLTAVATRLLRSL
jgi:hypothetical protein